MDLRTRYLGLELRSPLVASASPLTGDLESLRRLQDAGAAAVVLPSLFEEQIEHESMEIDRLLATGAESFPEATSFFPVMDDYNTGPRHYLALLEAARAALRIPVIASLNGTSPGGWLHYARLLEEAGASAIELNIYSLAADLDTTSSEVESRYVRLVTQIRGVVQIPLAVKLSPFYTALGGFARELVNAGADGLVLFNRFYQPDLDLDTLEVTPRLVLSTSAELRLPLRWIALLHGRLEASLAATTGVHTAADVAKLLLAGADVTMLTSALLQHGPGHLISIENQLLHWMAEHEYGSVEQLKGSVSMRHAPDPTAFERANYLKTLASYSTRNPV